MSLTIEDYSEKSVVVRGDTTKFQEELAGLGGTANAKLRDGAGWIFSKKKEGAVRKFIDSLSHERVEEKVNLSVDQLVAQLRVKMSTMNEAGVLGVIRKLLATEAVSRERNEDPETPRGKKERVPHTPDAPKKPQPTLSRLKISSKLHSDRLSPDSDFESN